MSQTRPGILRLAAPPNVPATILKAKHSVSRTVQRLQVLFLCRAIFPMAISITVVLIVSIIVVAPVSSLQISSSCSISQTLALLAKIQLPETVYKT